MRVQDVHPHLDEASGAHHGVGDVDQVSHDPDPIETGGTDRLLDHRVVGVGEDAYDRGAGLRGHLDLECTRVRNLHVGHDLVAGEALGERTDGGHPLALDQGRPDLDPVGSPCDRLRGDHEGPWQFEEVERDLEDRRTHTGRGAHPAPIKISQSVP
ncbi:hypothetical protein DSECCO2_568330 [anaerobic digester metagenome]